MKVESFGILEARFNAYVDTFRIDGELPPMMELKRIHTGKVLENARAIVAGEGFDPRTAALCEAAALLHDTGRFEQLRKYGTFRDADSVDHAVFSRDTVEAQGWIKGWDGEKTILDAVRFHNAREIPSELEETGRKVCEVVRDADKLDIFRVLEDEISATDLKGGSRAFWNLPLDARPNPAVTAAIREGRPVKYRDIVSFADFVLVQVGWIRGELVFETSRRLCAERGHMEFRRKLLNKVLDGDPVVDELCRTAHG